MKTLKSSQLHLSLLPYLMGLLFLFSAYPAMADLKQAQSRDKLGIGSEKTFTFTGSSTLIARSTKPEIVLFSKARHNTKYDTFSSDSVNGSFTPFNLGSWINTTVTGKSGYSFGGFTCVSCSKILLPIEFHLNQTKLTSTNQISPDGDTIFRLIEHPSVGISFQLGTQHKNNAGYLPSLTFDSAGIAQVGNIETYFDNAVSIFFLVRVKLHLLNDQIQNNSQDILLTDLDLGYIKLKRSEFRNDKRVKFIIEDNGRIHIHLQPPKIHLIHQQRQCYPSNNGNVPNTVKLNPVKKSRFDRESEIEGGQFELRVSCNKTENQINNKWLFPVVKVTFTGQNGTTNNGQNDLLYTQTGIGHANGVSLKIKRDGGNGDFVKYGLDSPNMNNRGQFTVSQQPSQVDKNAQETFKVYYVKDKTRGGEVTEGKVKAVATFTMSYQ